MTRNFRRIFAVMVCSAILPQITVAEPKHGIAMYGEPALAPDFVSLPYANPAAPSGGQMVFGETGGFDSLNPYILKGRAPWGIQTHVFESLMGRNWDEPFALYGLLAESVETPANREWVEFSLRPEARFSDGSAVTVEDVIWSMDTLATEGKPRYRNAWQKVAKVEKTGERSVRFTFNEPDAELPLLMGLRPILKKADWDGVDFARSSLRIPIGTGPYTVGEMEPDRFINFVRNDDYWGRDIAFNQGRNNIDTLRYDFFVDSSVRFQAFTAGEVSVYREGSPALWATEYDFPAVTSGRIVKAEIPHGRPSGMSGFVFNTRRDRFADLRVREALLSAFNFEFINETLNGGVFPRRTSYLANSRLAMSAGPAEDRVRALLEPFADTLAPDVMEAYSLPVSDGSPRNRSNMRRAVGLLEEAGWTVQDGTLRNDAGEAFTIEVLLTSGSTESANVTYEALTNVYRDALAQLGITAGITIVDRSQYNERLNSYDFDMTPRSWNLSLSPGNEQMLYWGSDGVKTPGTRNYMGMNSPAAEAMISHMLTTRDQSEFTAAVRALDRVLTTGRYVIPFWYSNQSFVAHDADLHYPATLPVYGDWIGWMPDVWWFEE